MDWLGIIAVLFIPIVLSLLGELAGALFKTAFPRAARWWRVGGDRTVRLWVLTIGGALAAIILVVIGIRAMSTSAASAWLLLLAGVPGLVGFTAFVALMQRSAIGQGYRRSRDGSWSAGQ